MTKTQLEDYQRKTRQISVEMPWLQSLIEKIAIFGGVLTNCQPNKDKPGHHTLSYCPVNAEDKNFGVIDVSERTVGHTTEQMIHHLKVAAWKREQAIAAAAETAVRTAQTNQNAIGVLGFKGITIH